jgi:hypothetical protein
MSAWSHLFKPLDNPTVVTAGFGLGVQSTTMLLMAKHGLITPMPHAAIVGDTVVELTEAYEHLRFIQSPNVGLPFPVKVVSAGNLGDDTLASAASWAAIGGADSPRELWRTAARIATPPFFTRGPRVIAKKVELEPLPLLDLPGGMVEMIVERVTARETFGILRRQCTREYKIDPVNAEIRRLLGLAPGEVGPRHHVAEHWIGLTTDEVERVQSLSASPPYIYLRHPLIELGLSRGDCIEWLRRNGYPVPAKSRCIFCPYQTDELWLDMKLRAPADFEFACAIDRSIRNGVRGTTCQLFLHASRTPLEDVDFTRPAGLWSNEGFRNECEGVCGI